MPANTVPIFTLTPRIGMALINTANTNLNGSTGTYTTILTAGSNGTRLDRVIIKAITTTTAGMVRLFIADATPTLFLFREVAIPAITISASVAGYEFELNFPYGYILPANFSLRASTEKAESFNIVAMGGDY